MPRDDRQTFMFRCVRFAHELFNVVSSWWLSSAAPNVYGNARVTCSATFPKEIQRLAADFLKDYIFLAVYVTAVPITPCALFY
jgi:hypothetical protein